MRADVVAKDCWIVGQLARIRILERELIDAFGRFGPGAGEDLRRRVDELNSWLNLVEDALGANTCSSRRPVLRGGRSVMRPVRSPATRSSAA
jgi:hypothetical protein